VRKKIQTDNTHTIFIHFHFIGIKVLLTKGHGFLAPAAAAAAAGLPSDKMFNI
jgi:hypothetical protein